MADPLASRGSFFMGHGNDSKNPEVTYEAMAIGGYKEGQNLSSYFWVQALTEQNHIFSFKFSNMNQKIEP